MMNPIQPFQTLAKKWELTRKNNPIKTKEEFEKYVQQQFSEKFNKTDFQYLKLILNNFEAFVGTDGLLTNDDFVKMDEVFNQGGEYTELGKTLFGNIQDLKNFNITTPLQAQDFIQEKAITPENWLRLFEFGFDELAQKAAKASFDPATYVQYILIREDNIHSPEERFAHFEKDRNSFLEEDDFKFLDATKYLKDQTAQLKGND